MELAGIGTAGGAGKLCFSRVTEQEIKKISAATYQGQYLRPLCRKQKIRSKLKYGKNSRTRHPGSLRPVAARQQLPSHLKKNELKNRCRVLAIEWKDEYIPLEETIVSIISRRVLSVGNWCASGDLTHSQGMLAASIKNPNKTHQAQRLAALPCGHQ